MLEDIKTILFDEKQIDEMTSKIASQIDKDYEDTSKKLLLVGILNGVVVFMTDLMRKIKRPLEIDFMKVSSYGSGTKTSGKIDILLDIKRSDLSELDVIIVDDIIDSGNTLSCLVERFKSKGAASVATCTLFDKPSRRMVEFVPDYCGAEIPDEFIVGYGLDYAESYRTLPFVGVLKSEVYEK